MSRVQGWAALVGSAGDTVPADSEVGPGLFGFLATFAVVLVSILLMLDLTRRLRRLRYRAETEAASGDGSADEQIAMGADGANPAHTGRTTDQHGHPAGQAVEPEASDEHDR